MPFLLHLNAALHSIQCKDKDLVYDIAKLKMEAVKFGELHKMTTCIVT